MKKIIMILFTFTLFLSGYGAYFKEVNEFSATVKEESFYNNEKKIKEYILKIAFPDKVYKEMLFPTLNAGEKYLYKNGKKVTYYPILEETIEENMDEDENAILKTLKDIKKENDEILTLENDGKLEKIVYTDGYEVYFFDYANVNGTDFPQNIQIFENGYLVTKLEFSNLLINENFAFEDINLNE